MSALAVLLIAVGVGDIVRRVCRAVWPAVLAAVAAVVVVAGLAALWHPGDLVLLAVAAVTGGGWQVLCARSERTGAHEPVALGAFLAGVAVLLALSGWASAVGGVLARWADWVALPAGANPDPGRVLMVIAVVLLQLATGNQLVRLVLGSVGAVKPAGQPQPSDKLKGGRLLGPMERLLILGLGLAGQLTAATAVVAAKSIIRFPEINAQKARENGLIGIDEVTEYFLVGSFASWTLALAGLALAQ